MMTFGDMIKVARKGKFSQKQLGAEVGVWDTYIGQIEKGGKIPSDEICIKLAHVLGLDERKLLLMAYQERAAGPAAALFGQVAELIDSPVELEILEVVKDPEIQRALKDPDVQRILKDPAWLELLAETRQVEAEQEDILALIRYILSNPHAFSVELLEGLRDPELQEALKDPNWREALVKGSRLVERDLPGLIRTIGKMDAQQWQALSGMIAVMAPK